jgi:flagellar motor switch protein FliG
MNKKMNTLFKVFLSSIIAISNLFFAGLILAAETSKTFEVPAKKDEIEEVRFKDEMEARLNRDLQAYLGNNRFIIHVEAELKKTRTVVKEEEGSDKNIPQRPVFSSQPLPATSSNNRPQEIEETLPGLPTSDLPIFEDNSAEMDALKGRVQQLESERQQALSYAEELRREAEKQIKKIKEKTLGYRNSISKLTITLVLDKTLSDEQVEFIRNLITRKARLDELRGDSLKIVRTEFKDVEKTDPVLDWWQEYQGWLMLACFGFMMLLLLFALYLFNKRLSESLKESQRRSDNFDSLTVPAAVDMAPMESPEDDNHERRRQLNEMRQELVTIGLGQPQLFQQRISEQLNSGNSQNVMALYDVMGKSLFRSLCPKMPSQELDNLADQVDRQPLDSEQKMSGLNNLRHELLKALGDDEASNAPFAFLEKLNDSQVLYLIKEEDTRIKALVLSQVPAQRAASLVQRLQGSEQSAVAYELGEFETLPVSTFKDVADRLAQKSLNVPSFENVSANGLSVLINMLDTMSSGEETRLLKTLKADKPETYYRLRQVYYTYADLMRTPERIIANELRDIDRNVMALSLCNTPTEFKRHILSGLPAKLRSSVISELKVQEGQASQEQTEQARNHVVGKMREVLKAGRFSMDELIAVANPS